MTAVAHLVAGPFDGENVPLADHADVLYFPMTAAHERLGIVADEGHVPNYAYGVVVYERRHLDATEGVQRYDHEGWRKK